MFKTVTNHNQMEYTIIELVNALQNIQNAQFPYNIITLWTLKWVYYNIINDIFYILCTTYLYHMAFFVTKNISKLIMSLTLKKWIGANRLGI